MKKISEKINEIKKLKHIINNLEFNNKRNILEQNILFNKQPGITNYKYCNHNIIVSLTTYGKRINDVHLTIESIMEQTLKANKIILWLDYSFEGKRLPQSLKYLQEKGLEIKYCEDLKSYKKLIPALQQYPNDAIITIDDDLLYDFNLLEKLISAYLEDPAFIYCARHHRIRLNNDGAVMKYNEWEFECADTAPNILNFPTTGAGTIFPPKIFDNEVFNKKVFMDICKFADDIWFKAMAVKSNVLSKRIQTNTNNGTDYLTNNSVQDIGLCNINTKELCLNDVQFKNVFEKYNLYTLLSTKNRK